MPTPLAELFALLTERADAETLPRLYALVSVPTATVRTELREAGLAWLDPEVGARPSIAQLDATAREVIRRARGTATAVGAAAGALGGFAVPPELAAALVQSLRLAQRLAVVYGVDPETDAGRALMWRAFAAGWEVELPTQGATGLRVRDLPELLRTHLPSTEQATVWVGRQVVRRAVAQVSQRVGRWLPGLGAGLAALGARRRLDGIGARMVRVYRRSSEALPFEIEEEELAVEV